VFLYVLCVVYFSIYFILFLFLFLFLVDVGRPSGGDTHQYKSYVVAAVSQKEGKLNSIICVTQFILYNFVYLIYIILVTVVMPRPN